MKWVSNTWWHLYVWIQYYVNSFHLHGIHSPFVFEFHQSFWKKNSRNNPWWEDALKSWFEKGLQAQGKKSIFAVAYAYKITDDQWNRLQEMATLDGGTVLIKGIRNNRNAWQKWNMLSDLFTCSIDTGSDGILVAKRGQEKEYFWLK